MLDALRAARLRHRRATATALHVHGLGGRLAVQRGRAVPRQCRHRDAPADRRAGPARRHAGRTLRAARRAAHARAADRRPGRCTAPARLRASTDLGQPGFPPLRAARRGRRHAWPSARRSACAATSRASSSPRCCWRCRWPAQRGPIVDRGRGRADLQALRRDHAERCWRASASRCSATAGSASRSRAGSRYRSPGDIHVEGDASSASYFIALGAIAATDAPLRIEGVGARFDPGRHPLRRRRARDGRRRAQRGRTALEVRRGAWPLKAIDARLQPHSRRRDDAGRDGAVRRRPDAR